MKSGAPCLVGQVFVDFVQTHGSEPMMRLGGIMHAARALWTMGISFGFAYIAPSYLKQDAEAFAVRYGATSVSQIGIISRCPNVVIVGEGKEIGSQGYDYLLRDQSECTFNLEALKDILHRSNFSDFLIFPGGFPLGAVLEELGTQEGSVFADVNFIPEHLADLSLLGRKFSTLILSTSSELFLNRFAADTAVMTKAFGPYAESVLLKENRGGSRLFSTSGGAAINNGAQVCTIRHSVGVGDFFDAVFVAKRHVHGDETAIGYASWGAAEYASYFDDELVHESMQAVLSIPASEIKHLQGVELPWEVRKQINVYLAAPDFDYVNTAELDRLSQALEYHNFSPRRPVQEHGQARADSSRSDRRRLAEADLNLLTKCDLLIGVLLFDDPGTLIEIGIAIEKQKPVIVFDPFNRANNLMLTELPILVTPDLDRVLMEVFVQAANIVNEKR